MQRKKNSWKKIYIFSILKMCGNDVSKLKMTLAFIIYMTSTDATVPYADMNVNFFPAIIFYVECPYNICNIFFQLSF